MPENYSNKRCLIIGATGGLGSGFALEMAKMGASLTLMGRDRRKLEELKNKCVFSGANKVNFYLCDFSDDTNKIELDIDKIVQTIEPVDLVFNCSIQSVSGNIIDCPIVAVESIYRINVLAPIIIIKTLIFRAKISNTSKYILISSGTAYYGVRSEGIYSSTKAANERIAECLRQEVKKYGIDVIIVSPGPMNTKTLINPKHYGESDLIPRPTEISKPDFIAKKVIGKLFKVKSKLYLSKKSKLIELISVLFPSLLIHLTKLKD